MFCSIFNLLFGWGQNHSIISLHSLGTTTKFILKPSWSLFVSIFKQLPFQESNLPCPSTLPPKEKTSKNTFVWSTWLYPYFVHMRWSSVQSLPQRTAFAAKRHLGDPTKSQEIPIPAQWFCRETMVSSILDDEIYIYTYIMERPNFRFLFLLKVVVPHVLMFSNLCPMFHRYIKLYL